MQFWKGHIFSLLTVFTLTVPFLYSCSPVDLEFIPNPEPGHTEDEFVRTPVSEYRNVFLLYSMGYNDLRGYLTEDINDVLGSQLMKNRRDIVLVCSHITEYASIHPYYFDPEKPVSPTLTKISREADGSIRKDTLLVMDPKSQMTSKDFLKDILTYTKENFDAENYGLLMSSHASGWVPEGYLSDPSAFENLTPIGRRSRRYAPAYHLRKEGEPVVKTMGVHYLSFSETTEMEITDLADAFPFKMDYIIFDACYMGGIEVAYQLRNVTDRMIFSQTEILGDGMDYKNMTKYLFAEGGPDLEGFCQGYYDYYNSKSGWNRSATISLIDCSRLDALAQTTNEIISKYRDGLNTLQSTRDVQRYYRSSYESRQKWFYDFGDIIKKCGLSEDDLSAFDAKLNDAVIYKAATPWFISDIQIKQHSGFSMYLPFKENRDYLNNFYKTLEWNKAVNLIP
jgi:hypothetical protein